MLACRNGEQPVLLGCAGLSASHPVIAARVFSLKSHSTGLPVFSLLDLEAGSDLTILPDIANGQRENVR